MSTQNSTNSAHPRPFVELRPVNESTLQYQQNGKTYKVTKLRQRVGGSSGDWVEVDLSKLSDTEKRALTTSIEDTSKAFHQFKNIPQGLENAHSITLHFNQEYQDSPSLFQSTMGRVFSRFAWKPQPCVLEEIRYQTSKGAKTKTFKVGLNKYSPEDQQAILNITNPLAQTLQQLYKNQYPTSFSRKFSSRKLPEVKGVTAPLRDAVQEVNGKDNKCAARSIATIKKARGEISDEIEEFIKSLVAYSVRQIRTNDAFIQGSDDPTQPSYNALLAAVNEYNADNPSAPIDTTKSPIEIREAYLQKMTEERQMLDRPFFLALQKPTLILEIKDEAFRLRDSCNININNPNCSLDIDNLSEQDLKKYYIVLYTDNHYDAVIPKAEHIPALQAVLRKAKN